MILLVCYMTAEISAGTRGVHCFVFLQIPLGQILRSWVDFGPVVDGLRRRILEEDTEEDMELALCITRNGAICQSARIPLGGQYHKYTSWSGFNLV